MIAACPKCGARYRVDPERIRPEGARLKCAKCDAVFRVRAPGESTTPVAPPPPLSESPTVVPVASPTAPVAASETAAPAEGPSAPAGAEPVADSSRLVLIADPEVDSSKATGEAARSWGLEPVIVHDGVEAMLTVQRMMPAAVVLDAALPKMYGFQVCEVIKRNESLRHMTVTLVGAIHHKDRYRRPPSELYGADHYLERPDLPDGLKPILVQAGLPVAGGDASTTAAPFPAPPAPEPTLEVETPVAPAPPAVVPQAPAAPEPIPAPLEQAAPPEPAPADDGLADERAKAERLARIIISDILLYNAEKFEAAMASGDVVGALDAELAEGRALFVQRVDARVRDDRDYLTDELKRVAAERGGG